MVLLSVLVGMLLAQPAVPTELERRAATILIGRFEAVARSTPRAVISAFIKEEQGGQMLSAPFDRLVDAIRGLGESSAFSVIENAKSLLLGARDFRPPSGLGAVGYQFCYIVVLAPGQKAEQYLQNLPTETAEGVRVFRWQTESDGRRASYFATYLAAGYLVVASSIPDLLTVTGPLGLLAADTSHHAESIGRFERHEIWVFRKDEKASSDYDSRKMVPHSVRSVAAFSDSGSGNCIVQLTTAPQSTAGRAGIRISPDLPLFVRQGATWQAQVQLTGTEEDVFSRFFVIMSLLGFGAHI